jgi:penicillin-binding protein 2
MRRGVTYTALRSVVILLFLVLGGRLWYMQIVRVNAYRAIATERRTRTQVFPASRGIIYDSHGRPLVRNLPELNVTVTPSEWDYARSNRESALLSRLLHHRPAPSRIRWLIWSAVRASKINTTPVTIRQGVPYRTFISVASNANRLPGVTAGSTLNHRVYLDSPPYALSHILGYTGSLTSGECIATHCPSYTGQRYQPSDIAGRAGLEAIFDSELHGTNGVESTLINSNDDQTAPWRITSPAVPGDGLRLTINSTFENEVAQDVEAAMHKNGWPYGNAVVMNPWNGHILAMVSLPSYNANTLTQTSYKKYVRAYNRLVGDRRHPLVDNSIDGEYPPGSIYKVITATAGLATGVISPSTIVDDTGQLQRYPGGYIFHGWYGPGLGPVNVVRAIAQSSDIFFYQVAGGGPQIAGSGLGPYRLGRWARKYGLGHRSGIELPDATGLVPSPSELERTQHRPWSYGDSYNMGIGQGDDLVTPLQMAVVTSVIANGGSLVRPTLIEGLTGPDGKHFLPGKDFGAVPDIVRPHFVKPWIAHLIGYGMRLGLTMHGAYPAWGTSYSQVDQRTEAAGKTGTAQTFLPGTNPPVASADAWWMGFAPYNHPKIAVAVMFPYADSEGAYAAAPVASKIILDYEHKPAPNWLSKVITRLDFSN